jgi:hypothetical protein
MISRWCLGFLALLGMWPAISLGQQTGSPPLTVQRDPQGIAILTQTLSAAGGIQTISPLQDYSAAGNITYYWARKEVQGSVVVKGRGTNQFRLDATLQAGVRSWAVSNGAGFVKEPDGATKPIFYQNTVNFGSLTFPFPCLVAVLEDSSISVSYVGLETKEGQPVQHVQTKKIFPSNIDPRGVFSKLTTRDFFVDPTTFRIVSTLDMVHPDDAYTIDHPHEMFFSDYRSTNGALVPFSMTETVSGQRTYTLQLNQISFNTGLSDSDFEP